MEDGFLGGLLGFVMGAALVVFLLHDNPTIHGSWYCSDWQIIHDKPECHVMTKREN